MLNMQSQEYFRVVFKKNRCTFSESPGIDILEKVFFLTTLKKSNHGPKVRTRYLWLFLSPFHLYGM